MASALSDPHNNCGDISLSTATNPVVTAESPNVILSDRKSGPPTDMDLIKIADTTTDREVLPFPPEVRNKIYSFVFSDTYLVYWSSDQEERLSRHAEEPGLLLASKATRKEALDLFYWYGTFQYKIDNINEHHCAPPPQLVVDQMQNIELEMFATYDPCDTQMNCGCCEDCEKDEEEILVLWTDTIAMFSLDEVMRKLLLIRLMACCWSPVLWSSNLFIQRLTEIQGFQTIVIEIHDQLDRPSHLGGGIVVNECPRTEYIWSYVPVEPYSAFRSELERLVVPEWGPVVDEGDVTDSHEGYFAIYLEFRPYQRSTQVPAIEAKKSEYELAIGEMAKARDNGGEGEDRNKLAE